jgi:POT family proton-dependent oligopeptide transporter
MDLHIATSLLEPRTWLAVGLGLIAIGSGGIKPCVSAHLGDQVDENHKDVLDDLFSYFYFAINFGSTFSTLMIPFVLEYYGPGLAFGIPGVLMFIATLIFYIGRNEFVAMPAAGWQLYRDELFSKKGLKSLLGLGVLYIFIAPFWALFDQTGSAWVLQAEKMDLGVNLGFMSFEMLPSQVQVINPILVMAFIPIFTLYIYPFAEKFVKVTAKRKIGVGFFFAAASFAVIAVAEQLIQTGHTPSVAWHFWAYVLITMGEILISITALEFSYTQAPNSMKSFIMAVFLLSVSLGNVFTAQVNKFIQNADGTVMLQGASYYWFFVYVILGAGVLYCIASTFYKEESYLQDHHLAEEHG